jgi:hypothetical protein
MKGKPRISLSMKKTRQGRKVRAAVAACDRVFSTNSADHVGVAGIVYLSAPAETINGPTFYTLVSQEMPSLKDPGRLAAAAGHAIKRKIENSSVTRCEIDDLLNSLWT